MKEKFFGFFNRQQGKKDEKMLNVEKAKEVKMASSTERDRGGKKKQIKQFDKGQILRSKVVSTLKLLINGVILLSAQTTERIIEVAKKSMNQSVQDG